MADDKTFTQAEMDSIIEGRLAREREKYADYDSLKDKAGKYDEMQAKGKTDLAKLAKQYNLDAIHDTVHEMARDEARHGKAFAGLLKRYFGK